MAPETEPDYGLFACSVETMPLPSAPKRLVWQNFSPHLFPIRHRQAELGQNFFVRDGLVATEPLVGFGDSFTFSSAEEIPVFIGREHCFKQMGDGVELAWTKPIQQVVSALTVNGHKLC